MNIAFKDISRKAMIVLLSVILVTSLAPSTSYATGADEVSPATEASTVEAKNAVPQEAPAPERPSAPSAAQDNKASEQSGAVKAAAQEDLVLHDAASGVTVTVSDEAMPEGVARGDMALRVAKLTDEQVQEGLQRIGKDESQLLEALDISLYNRQTGEEVQPRNGATVTVVNSRIEALEQEVVDVHRLNDDNTVTRMDAVETKTSENKRNETTSIAFETEHFTEYFYTVQNGNLTVAYIQQVLDLAKNDSRQLEEGAETQIRLRGDVSWGPNEMLTIPAGLNVTFVNEKGSTINLTRNATRGTMIHVEKGATLTLPSGFVMDGWGGEYRGNDDPSIKGVFVHTEGTLNLDGVEMKNAHVQSGDNDVSMAAPVVSHGGTINMTAGEIHGSWFTANPRNAGNPYSAGAIIAAPSLDGSAQSSVTISGGRIYGNKVGWDMQDSGNGKDIYRDYGGDGYAAWNATGEGTIPGTGTMHASTIIKANELSGPQNSFQRHNVKSGVGYPANGGDIEKRTPGVGAILLLGSNLTMSGGQIEGNHGEAGAIGVNGVGPQWDDLFTDAPKDGIVSWNGANGVGLNVSRPADLKSTFTMTGGVINGNVGITNGGVFVGRYGTMVMGSEDQINQNNDAIVIAHNKAFADNGGGGIGLMSQRDHQESLSNWRKQNQDGADAEPHLDMYSGTIRENHSVIKGGGIYAATDSVSLYGGRVLNNQADQTGGGMYVEAGYTCTFPNVIEITNNKAITSIAGSPATREAADQLNAMSDADRFKAIHEDGVAWGWDSRSWNGANGMGAGGGLWLCPEGASIFEVDKLVVHDNTAVLAGEDLYKVVNSQFDNTGLLYLPSSDPLGREIAWIRDGGLVYKDSARSPFGTALTPTYVEGFRGDSRIYGLYPIGGFLNPEDAKTYPRANEIGVKEEVTRQANQYDSLAVKALAPDDQWDSAGKYASVLFDGNISTRGGGIGADGRLKFGANTDNFTEHDIAISKNWKPGTLKRQIDVKVYAQLSDGSKRLLRTIPLNRDNQYSGVADGLSITVLDSDGVSRIPLFEHPLGSDEWVPTRNLLLVESIDGEENVALATPYATSQNIEYVGSESENIEETSENQPVGTYTVERTIYKYNMTVSNDAKDKYPVSISKKALNADGSFLVGAKLKIVGGESEDGEVVEGCGDITSADAASVFELMEGVYTLVEVDAPTGYKIADPITFKVEKLDGDSAATVFIKQGDDWVKQDSASVTMVDEREQQKVTVNKKWGTDADTVPVDLELYANGEKVPTDELKSGLTNPATVSADTGWSYTWEGKANSEYFKPGTKFTVKELTSGSFSSTVSDPYVKTFVEQDGGFDNSGANAVVLTRESDGKLYYMSSNPDGYLTFGGEVAKDENGNLSDVPNDATWDAIPTAASAGKPEGAVQLVNRATNRKLAAMRDGSSTTKEFRYGLTVPRAVGASDIVMFDNSKFEVKNLANYDTVNESNGDYVMLGADHKLKSGYSSGKGDAFDALNWRLARNSDSAWYGVFGYDTDFTPITAYQLAADTSDDAVSKADEVFIDVTNEHFEYEFMLKKTDSDDGRFLDGAEFELWKVDPDSPQTITGQNLKGSLVGKKTTQNGGVLNFGVPSNGDYYLVETNAPDGYTKRTEPIKLKVDGGKLTIQGDATGVSVFNNVDGASSQAGSVDVVDEGSLYGLGENHPYPVTNLTTSKKVSDFAFCLNPDLLRPGSKDAGGTKPDNFTRYSNVSYETIKDLVDAKDTQGNARTFTEADYLKVKRAVVWYANQAETLDENERLWAFEAAFMEIGRVIDPNAYAGKDQDPTVYGYPNYPVLVREAMGSSENDALIAVLEFDLYNDERVTAGGKKFQNMVSVRMTEGSDATIVVTNDKQSEFALPFTGGTGILMWIVAGVLLMGASAGGYAFFRHRNARRPMGKHSA